MITADILSAIQRFTHGLFYVVPLRDTRSQAERTDLSAMAAPIPSSLKPFLPHGGMTNVATNAASYWASMPRLELPETNLTPSYLEDFVLNPPMEAA